MNGTQVLELDPAELVPTRPACYSRDTVANTGMVLPMSEMHIPKHIHTVIPIWAVETARGKYEAKSPISVKIAYEDGLFFAANDAMKLFGSGETPDDAIIELREHLAFFVAHYEKTSRNALAGEALRMKNLYEQTFIRQGDAA